jgi:hypothetical protein
VRSFAKAPQERAALTTRLHPSTYIRVQLLPPPPREAK